MKYLIEGNSDERITVRSHADALSMVRLMLEGDNTRITITVDPPVAELPNNNKAGSNVLCMVCNHPINKHNNDEGIRSHCFWHDENDDGVSICSCRKFVGLDKNGVMHG